MIRYLFFAIKNLKFIESNGAPEEIRTPDLSVRSRVLYPAKLLVHI